MIRTPYYDLAEKIGNAEDVHCFPYFICWQLSDPKVFISWYKYDARNSKLFKTGMLSWMSSECSTTLENNNHRIIALLLLHEMEVNP